MGEHTHNAWLRAQCIQHLWSVFGSWSLKRSNCDLLVDIPKNLGLDILLLPVSLLLLFSSDLLGQHWPPSFLSWLTTIHQILLISIVVVIIMVTVSKTLVIVNIMQDCNGHLHLASGSEDVALCCLALPSVKGEASLIGENAETVLVNRVEDDADTGMGGGVLQNKRLAMLKE